MGAQKKTARARVREAQRQGQGGEGHHAPVRGPAGWFMNALKRDEPAAPAAEAMLGRRSACDEVSGRDEARLRA